MQSCAKVIKHICVIIPTIIIITFHPTICYKIIRLNIYILNRVTTIKDFRIYTILILPVLILIVAPALTKDYGF